MMYTVTQTNTSVVAKGDSYRTPSLTHLLLHWSTLLPCHHYVILYVCAVPIRARCMPCLATMQSSVLHYVHVYNDTL